MKQTRARRGLGILFAVSLVVGAGCAATGQTVPLDIQQKQAAVSALAPEPVRIVIEPFDDRRTEKTRLGLRTHLWGGVTYFGLAGERPGEVLAQALAERLKARGWKDRAWTVRVASSAGTTAANEADIVISGQLLDFSANAKSRIFSTVVNTSSKFVIAARNLGDRSTTTRNIEGSQRDTIFWFDDADAQQLLAATVKDGFDRYLAETMIEGKAVRSAH
ncbi:MAG: hypothetical protein NTX84_00685 [Nitrospirae bacterium]|nr:hypothetical protein [Nitrospirota bacterium]